MTYVSFETCPATGMPHLWDHSPGRGPFDVCTDCGATRRPLEPAPPFRPSAIPTAWWRLAVTAPIIAGLKLTRATGSDELAQLWRLALELQITRTRARVLRTITKGR